MTLDDRPEEEILSCADCGELVSVGPGELAYGFGEAAVLCFNCALRRGGEYHEPSARWARQPDVSDLARKYVPRP